MKTLAILLSCAIILLGGAGFAAPGTCPHDPVCALGKDGKRTTVGSACKADRAGARVLHKGACEGGDVCSMIYTPVCATDPGSGSARTYSSLCVAEHANATLVHDGACTP